MRLADKVLEIVGSGDQWTLESLVKETGGSKRTIQAILSTNGHGKGMYKGGQPTKVNLAIQVSLDAEDASNLKQLSKDGKRTFRTAVESFISEYLEKIL
jgi:hypothetical protein